MELEEMRDMLGAYKQLLEREKQMALEQHFQGFMGQLKIDNIELKTELKTQFSSLIDLLEEKIPMDQRMLAVINSPFIWNVMQHKTSAKERELRRLTDEISSFIKGASQGAQNEQQFVQNLLANSLKEVAKSIESGELKAADSPVMSWIDSMKGGLSDIFDKEKI
jgi:hypothetical protein|tara:strand:- start:16657 stop:17151 length:495 start_codon:yes stop_codon:yes gene_type:complete